MILKYMGSKSRITKYIVPIIQKYINDNDIETYIEAFVGGANVIYKVDCKHKYGSDINKYLIAILQRVKNKEPLLDGVSRELYSEVRSNYKTGKYEDWYVGNIGFLASYNGEMV
jgi:DNA adenine methylase